MPCCGAVLTVDDLAEAMQESASDCEEIGKLVVRCPECSELVELNLMASNE